MPEAASDSVQLFWTGGWDSTFQLLRTVLLDRRQVEPYYIIDEARRSTGVELRAMRNIKSTLFERHNYTKELICPTQYVSVSDIAPDPAISGAYRRIAQRTKIGSQYEWLALFCAEKDIRNLQLGIHKHDRAHFVYEMVGATAENASGHVTVSSSFSGSDEHTLFHYFSFPLLDYTKIRIFQESEANGWLDIMEMTWFCFRPILGKPCGWCNPCKHTIQEGLGWRIPKSRRMLLPLVPIARTTKTLLKKTIGAFK